METTTKLFHQRGKRLPLPKGERKIAMVIAREMKKDGISVEQIAKFTKLAISEIENL